LQSRTNTYAVIITILFCFTSIAFCWEYIFRDRGDNREDQLGTVIEGIGDQNEDGFDDILVQMGRTQEWRIYYGGDPMDTIPDWSSPSDSSIYYSDGGLNLGDLNGDNIPEFYMSYYSRDEDNNRHEEWIIYFGGDEDTLAEMIMPEMGIIYEGGDVNGDGFNDIWQVSASYNHPEADRAGRIQLFLGSEEGPDTIPDFEIIGERFRESLGAEFSSGGDLNGDGYDDFCYTTNIDIENREWEDKILHIYFGGEEIDTSAGIHHDMRDSIGEYKARPNPEIINDLNGDGIDELVFSISDHRGSFVIFGRENYRLEPDVHLLPGNGLGGYHPISLGDVNGDDFNDLLCRDPWGVMNLGKINLFLGGAWMNGDYVFQLTGWDEEVLVPLGRGRCRQGCGDVNGDGFNDIMFSAYGRYNGGEVYIIGGSDEWQTKVEDDLFPDSYKLILHASPNPFNNQVTISYQVPVSGQVRLSVYDVQGRLVEQLTNLDRSRGEYTTAWNCSNSGIYLLLMQAGNKQVVKKVVCIK